MPGLVRISTRSGPGSVELRGKGILVDADLADGGSGGQTAGRKSVDEEPCAGVAAGHGLNLKLQLLGIGRERLEVGTPDDDGSLIVVGAGIKDVASDRNLFALHLYLQRNGEPQGLAGLNADAALLGPESPGLNGEGVPAGCDFKKMEGPLRVGCDSLRPAGVRS